MVAVDLNIEVFRSFAFWSGVLIVKMLMMSVLTGRQRFRKNVFISPEDCALNKKAKTTPDEDVERVRRAHLNDMENILPFFVIGFLYTLTNPASSTATLLFKLFAGGRIAHTIVYAVTPLPQPSRAIAFFVGYAVEVYMAVKVITYFY